MHRALQIIAPVVVVALVMSSPRARACSTFSARSGSGFLVAKNFDWSSGEGWIVANERGRHRSKLVLGGSPEIASWSARFASLSFTTVGPGFPISGTNEAGLTIEALVDTSAAMSVTPDPARLTGLELVQYGLDRFDVAADLADFAERNGVSQLAVPLHFFACDRGGGCVVIESRADGVHSVRGAELGVHALANRPFRVDAQASASDGAHSSGARFGAMAERLGAAPPHDVDEAFRLLDRVRIPGRTKWQIVWDGRDARVHFRDREGAAIASLRIDAANVACHGAPRVRAIGRASAADAEPFHPWSDLDTARAERGVLAQLGTGSPHARQLAAVVAAATHATSCTPSD